MTKALEAIRHMRISINPNISTPPPVFVPRNKLSNPKAARQGVAADGSSSSRIDAAMTADQAAGGSSNVTAAGSSSRSVIGKQGSHNHDNRSTVSKGELGPKSAEGGAAGGAKPGSIAAVPPRGADSREGGSSNSRTKQQQQQVRKGPAGRLQDEDIFNEFEAELLYDDVVAAQQ